MSKEKYKEIKMCLKEMCRIEFGKKLSEMKKTSFFIDDENERLIIKNYDDNIKFDEIIPIYLSVLGWEYHEYFQIGYSFNEFELIEFELDLDY